MKQHIQKDIGIVSSRTGSEPQRALLKTPPHSLVESKGGRFGIMGTEDPGGYTVFDDAGDKVDVTQVEVEHLRSFRVAGSSGKEIALEQQRLEEVPIGITQFEAGFDESGEFLQWGFDFLHLSANLIDEVRHPLLDGGFEQLLFGMEIEVNRSFADFGFFGYAFDRCPLKTVSSDDPAGRIKQLAGTKISDKLFFGMYD